MSPAQQMVRARELHATGFGVPEILRLLAADGEPVVCKRTVYRWVNPAAAELERRRHAAWKRKVSANASTFAWPSYRADVWKLGRMRRLRAAGLSFAAISKVMTIDFPHDVVLRDRQVEYALLAQERREANATPEAA